jgi:hypothetical protein
MSQPRRLTVHRFRLMRLYLLGMTVMFAIVVVVVAIIRTQADAP